ncbi:MAG: hypothetical protein AAF598_14435, partial [Bacteroidota bacterium]
MDQQGDTLWTKGLAGPLALGGEIWDVKFTNAGDIVVAWLNHDEGQKITKVDGNGNFVWEATYPFPSATLFNALAVDENDNIVAAGDMQSKLYFIKFDPAGNELWNSSIETTYNGVTTFDIVYVENGSFAFCGRQVGPQGYAPLTGRLYSNGFIGLSDVEITTDERPSGQLLGLTTTTDGGLAFIAKREPQFGGFP